MSYGFDFEVSLTIVFRQFRTSISRFSQLELDSFKKASSVAKTNKFLVERHRKVILDFKSYSMQFPFKNIAS